MLVMLMMFGGGRNVGGRSVEHPTGLVMVYVKGMSIARRRQRLDGLAAGLVLFIFLGNGIVVLDRASFGRALMRRAAAGRGMVQGKRSQGGRRSDIRGRARGEHLQRFGAER